MLRRYTDRRGGGVFATINRRQSSWWATNADKRMPRIVIPDDEPAVMAPSRAFRKLAAHDVRTYATRPSSAAELADRIGDSEIVINIRSTSRFTDEVLEKCPALRLISIWGTGTDNVDLVAASRKGVRVTNTPGVSALAVAEHTLTLIMAVAKRTVEVDREVLQGRWPRAAGLALAIENVLSFLGGRPANVVV
jgi:D-3-phosphoglycerate dehydrogenase